MLLDVHVNSPYKITIFLPYTKRNNKLVRLVLLFESVFMSSRNPIIAITGSSGAGTSTTTAAFDHIFRSLGISSVNVEGDSFHRFSRRF